MQFNFIVSFSEQEIGSVVRFLKIYQDLPRLILHGQFLIKLFKLWIQIYVKTLQGYAGGSSAGMYGMSRLRNDTAEFMN